MKQQCTLTQLSIAVLFVVCVQVNVAAPTSVLFTTDFNSAGGVADVKATIVGKDADGFSASKTLKASVLPDSPKTQFNAVLASLVMTANAGGWKLVAGELAQTSTTSDFRTVKNPNAGKEGEPSMLTEAIPGTSRPVLTLWMTQQRDGKTRYQTITSEQWPPDVRGAVLGLWRWLEAQA